MKTAKITVCLIVAAIMLSICYPLSFVSAASSQKDDIFGCEAFYDENELKEIIAAAESSSSVSRGIVSAEGIRSGNAYKIYYYGEGIFPEDLASGKSMQEMLSSAEHGWCIDTDGKTLWIGRFRGEWKVSSCSENSAENPGTVDFDAAKKAAALLESEYGAKDISVQCLYSRDCFGKYLIIYSSVGEYIVPFCCRPDFTGLENGKLYPAAGLGKILVENLPSDPTNWFPEEIVNDGAKAPAQPGVGFGIDNPAVYLPAVLIPVLAGIGAVIYRKRRTA